MKDIERQARGVGNAMLVRGAWLLPQRASRNLVIMLVAAFSLILVTAVKRCYNIPTSDLYSVIKPPRSKQAPLVEAEAKRRPSPSNPPSVSAERCDKEFAMLHAQQPSLSEEIVFSRRCVKPVFDSPNRDVVAHISNEPLLGDRIVVNLSSCAGLDAVPCHPLPLHVPDPYPKQDYSHLIFGVATSYKRMEDFQPAFAHWLANTGAHLVAVIVDVDETNAVLAALEADFSASGIKATFVAPSLKVNIGHGGGIQDGAPPVEHHHFMLVRDLLDRATAETRWISILDDDTFFPSLYPVNEELARHDHGKPVWLGALSDDFGAVKMFGYMAFGGAGTFLSLPLARQIEPHLEVCIGEAAIATGDGLLRDCVHYHTRTKLTLVPGLHQHDIGGDVSGFYESGPRPLSVHHWASWYREPLPRMAAITNLCGDCFLQRWRFGDDTLLANGYSITHYPQGLDGLDLDRIEGTWRGPGPQYDFSYGPLREWLPPSHKKSYRLLDSEDTPTGFRQLYVHRAERPVEEPEEGGRGPTTEAGAYRDEVVELVWQKS